ncbi:hypothetical protein JL720_13579 [Aureococcus anophagefferens]|nr:hypothetical protein JL720_13579 [Aureococcus anophagefferens]
MFDAMRKEKKAVGLQTSHICLPKNHKTKIPKSFCERNGGVMFLGDAGKAREILERWSEEIRAHPSKDGHDQVSLRTVLFDFRDDLTTCPVVQRRGTSGPLPLTRARDRRCRILARPPPGRLKYARRKAQGTICGFVP